MKPFWKCHIVSKILVKTSLKSDPFFERWWGGGGGGVLGADFPSFAYWPKIEKNGPKLRSYNLGALIMLFAFSYLGEIDFDKKPYIS